MQGRGGVCRWHASARALTQVVILSDTFEQFAKPLMAKLGWPALFCNTLEAAPSGEPSPTGRP